MSMTPLGSCTLTGPISSGGKTPRPPPSIIAGPPMPMLESLVAMITSQQPSSDGVAGEAAAGGDADQRHQPGQLAELEPGRVEAARWSRPRPRCRRAGRGRRRPRRRTRSAAASARPARSCGPSSGGCWRPGCRPAPCSRRPSPRSARRPRANSVAVDAAEADDHAVGRVLRDQLLQRCRGAGARRRPARRIRRRCRDRRGRRCSPARCAGRSCGGARRRRAGRRRGSWRGARGPRPGRGGCRRGRRGLAADDPPARPRPAR